MNLLYTVIINLKGEVNSLYQPHGTGKLYRDKASYLSINNNDLFA